MSCASFSAQKQIHIIYQKKYYTHTRIKKITLNVLTKCEFLTPKDMP